MGILDGLFGRKKKTGKKQVQLKLVKKQKSTQTARAGKARRVKPNVEKLKRNKDLQGLISALQYERDDDVRADAAFAFSAIRANKKAVEPLIRALKDDYFLVVGGAAKALGKMKDVRSVGPLIQTLLSSEAFTARSNVAVALGEIKDARAVEPLIQVLKKDEAPEVRERSAWALRQIKDVRAIEPLTRLLSDKDSNIREVATSAIKMLKKSKKKKKRASTAPSKTKVQKTSRDRGSINRVEICFDSKLPRSSPEKEAVEKLVRYFDLPDRFTDDVDISTSYGKVPGVGQSLQTGNCSEELMPFVIVRATILGMKSIDRIVPRPFTYEGIMGVLIAGRVKAL